MLNITTCDSRFVMYSKHLADLFFKQIKVLNLQVNISRITLTMIVLDKEFNLSKGLILYKRRDKSYTIFFRNAFSLKYKEEVKLYKLVFQLFISAIKGLRFSYQIDLGRRGWSLLLYISVISSYIVGSVRVARGSARF